ncbi:MAG TPA: PhoPQ-activated protein PqaA family protein [Chthonomonadaceae bacterium]|nr:PhoPQ-activated protein PqaA family protein [Chthonomonadaceae bacterium]
MPDNPINPLIDYALAPDASYGWNTLKASRAADGTWLDILLTSQVWHGHTWTHRLEVFVPDHRAAVDWAHLTIGADHGGPHQPALVDSLLARRAGIVCAHLFDVPNQPLFGGLREDELLAHTLSECLETRDASWPLLYPMVRSARRAMDTIASVCLDDGSFPPSRFVVHGASKRGWTTWLTAVVDPRVAAIVPEVYDNLNLFAQMPHQVKMWHAYSEMIEDYTEQRLQDKMRTPAGGALAMAIDPYTYREQLTLPKLLINSLNDRYWATDALNLYWDDLAGDKHLVYAPNQPHAISDRSGVAPTHRAFVEAVVAGTSLSEVASQYEPCDGRLLVSLTVSDAEEARVWIATSPTQDFRAAAWTSVPLQPAGGETFDGSVPMPAEGWTAAMADCRVPGPHEPYVLSTPLQILTRERKR